MKIDIKKSYQFKLGTQLFIAVVVISFFILLTSMAATIYILRSQHVNDTHNDLRRALYVVNDQLDSKKARMLADSRQLSRADGLATTMQIIVKFKNEINNMATTRGYRNVAQTIYQIATTSELDSLSLYDADNELTAFCERKSMGQYRFGYVEGYPAPVFQTYQTKPGVQIEDLERRTLTAETSTFPLSLGNTLLETDLIYFEYQNGHMNLVCHVPLITEWYNRQNQTLEKNRIGTVKATYILDQELADKFKKITGFDVQIFGVENLTAGTLQDYQVFDSEFFNIFNTTQNITGSALGKIVVSDNDYYQIARPFYNKEYIGAMAVLSSMDKINDNTVYLIYILSIIGAISLVLFLPGTMFFSRSLSRPIANLVESSHLIKNGDFSKELFIPKQVEMATLAEAFVSMQEMINRLLKELDSLILSVDQGDSHARGSAYEFKGDWKTLVNEVNSLIGIFRDQAKELTIAKEAADTANQSKSEFLANMSHEIRTPMNSVLGFAEILKGKETDPKKSHYIESIYTSGKALLSLINDILDLSKVEAGKIELQYSSVALTHLFQELETIFSQKAKDKGIELSTVLPEELPAALVMDETRVRQILINLLGNAIKFTEQGTISLEAECHFPEETHSKVQLEIRVRDSGIGIPAEQQAHIFDAFEQTKGQKVQKYGGTGLGLTISKRLVELMGGHLSVESTVGKGSTFIIKLPEVVVAAARLGESMRKILPEALEFKQATILITDDIDYNREILEAFLSEFNFTFLTACNGIEALSQIYEHRPDLILLDMKMPEMDGYEVIRRLKEDPSVSDIPIIAITASVLMTDVTVLSKLCDGFLPKPVSQEELVTEIARHLPYTEVEAPAPIQNEARNEAGNELPEMIAALAPDLRDQLYHAALDLDAGQIENLLDKHGDLPQELANKIKDLNRNFDFESLQNLLKLSSKSGGEQE